MNFPVSERNDTCVHCLYDPDKRQMIKDAYAEKEEIPKKSKKLYLVTVRGSSTKNHDARYNSTFVVAEDPTAAYDILRFYLDKNGIGFSWERELDTIKLVAENSNHPECKKRLLVYK